MYMYLIKGKSDGMRLVLTIVVYSGSDQENRLAVKLHITSPQRSLEIFYQTRSQLQDICQSIYYMTSLLAFR